MKSLPKSYSAGFAHVFAIVLLALAFAAVVFYVLKYNKILGETSPATSSCTTVTCSPSPSVSATASASAKPKPTPIATPISWKTETVTLTADNFYIIANGKRYGTKMTGLVVTSDPGNNRYTTLEATWKEKSVEMRLNIYFRVLNGKWTVSEARTYNGNKKGDWIYYKGFDGAKLGSALTRKSTFLNSDLSNNSNRYGGKVYFKNFYLLPTFNSLPGATGSLNATPNPCVVAKGKNVCTSKITYTYANLARAELCVQAGKSRHLLVSRGVSGTSVDAPWIVPGYNYNFTLRPTSTAGDCAGYVIASTIVKAKK